jgi:hypothetical protein
VLVELGASLSWDCWVEGARRGDDGLGDTWTLGEGLPCREEWMQRRGVKAASCWCRRKG